MAIEDRLLEKLAEMDRRAREIEANLATPEVAASGGRAAKLAVELGTLMKSVSAYRAYVATQQGIEEARELAASDPDPEMREMARAELETLERRAREQLDGLKEAFLAADPEADKDVIVEIRAGTGGEEAALFAADLFQLYSRFAERHRLKVEVIDAHRSDMGGFKEVIFRVKGPGAYALLRHESGGHRVQRVPKTESQGRIHTSMATVGVMPEVEDLDIEIRPEDLRVDTMRAGGPGGQHVNKTDSAVRLTHAPTGIVVQCQNERSQHKNRAIAWKMLRARLARVEEEKREAEEAEKYKNKARVGFGSQIRNYFLHPDQRVKDARTGHMATNFHSVLDGNIQDFLDAYLKWRVSHESN